MEALRSLAMVSLPAVEGAAVGVRSIPTDRVGTREEALVDTTIAAEVGVHEVVAASLGANLARYCPLHIFRSVANTAMAEKSRSIGCHVLHHFF